MKKRVFYGFVSTCAILAIGLAAYAGRWRIHDYARLRGYTPNPQISAISEDIGFTEYGERLFFVHDPAVLDAEQFNAACSGTNHGGLDEEVEETSSIILGCYDGRGIYIYDVVDERLDGIEEVTAAHEMLHAAYARLADGERSEINEWLSVAKDTITSARILSVIDSYSDLDRESQFNELHSIIGTEVEDLPVFLEDYYSQYFTDRSKVIDISKAYEQVFVEIKARIAEFDDQLASLSLRIRRVEVDLSQELNTIEQGKARLPVLLEQGRIDEYNALVRTLRVDIADYNEAVAQAGRLIDEYNALVVERNELGDEQNNLVQSIDSRYEQVEQ